MIRKQAEIYRWWFLSIHREREYSCNTRVSPERFKISKKHRTHRHEKRSLEESSTRDEPFNSLMQFRRISQFMANDYEKQTIRIYRINYNTSIFFFARVIISTTFWLNNTCVCGTLFKLLNVGFYLKAIHRTRCIVFYYILLVNKIPHLNHRNIFIRFFFFLHKILLIVSICVCSHVENIKMNLTARAFLSSRARAPLATSPALEWKYGWNYTWWI